MKTAIHTQRFVLRVQHRLTQQPYPEIHHGHSCDVEVSLNRAYTAEDAKVITAKVIAPLDGHLLNEILAQATGERLVDWIFRELEGSILGSSLQAVAIQETPKNRFVASRSPLFLG